MGAYGRQTEPEAWSQMLDTDDAYAGGVRYVPCSHEDAPDDDAGDWIEDPTESVPGCRVSFCHADEVTRYDWAPPAGPGADYMRAMTDSGIYHYERADEPEEDAR